MKNIDMVLSAVKKIANENRNRGVTTQEIAETLSIERTLISRYLNQLVLSGALIKNNSRPVQYFCVSELEDKANGEEDIIFRKFIGSEISLKKQINQCIAAVNYPGNGLPLVLTGNSGVGKSYLASLIFQYAKEKGIISSNSNFIEFNCADYANNVELLSSKLFGYKKGTFTDANEDHQGIIAKADGGYLFLDEIHRLNSENQEKLFMILDKGIYQPLGDHKYYPINIRLICATTEKPEDVLIPTFLRRIPIQVHLPDLKDRTVLERLQLIQYFYTLESKKFNRPFKISSDVINYLATCPLNGNIGELINIIKVSCANALKNNSKNELVIHMRDITSSFNIPIVKKYYNLDYLNISLDKAPNDTLKNYELELSFNSIFKQYYDFLCKESYEMGNDEEIIKGTKNYYHRITDIAYLENVDNSDGIYDELFLIHVREAITYLKNRYGLKFLDEKLKQLTNILTVLHSNYFRENEEIFRESIHKLYKRKNKCFIFVQLFFEYLSKSLNYESTDAERLFLTMWLIAQDYHVTKSNINVIILAHGNSTANSIASVVNSLFSDYMIEAFDMPIDIQLPEIVEKLKQYSYFVDKYSPVIFLVDMGSLFEIHTYIKDYFKGDIVVINNITTQLALSIGSMIHQKKNIVDIMDSVIKDSDMKYKFFQQSNKRRVFVTTCISGIGTAKRMKKVIQRCLPNNENGIDIVVCDYFSLKNQGINHEVFRKYDVMLVVTTMNLSVEGKKTMLLTEMLTEKNIKILRKIFNEVYTEKFVDNIIDNLVKSLTLENIISKMTILNPTRVVDNVSVVLKEMDKAFHLYLNENQRMILYMHIAILIERCIFNQSVDTNYVLKNDRKKISLLREIIDHNMIDFDVKIPDHELDLILNMIVGLKNPEYIVQDGENE